MTKKKSTKRNKSNKNGFFNYSATKKFPFFQPMKRRGGVYPVFNTMASDVSDVSGGDMGGMVGEGVEESTYKYSAILGLLPDNLHNILSYYATRIIPGNLLYSNPDLGIDGYEDEYHVSLLYGINEGNIDTLRPILSKIPEIEVNFGNISIYKTNPNFDFVVVEVESPTLTNVHEYLKETIDHDKVIEDFKLYCTLAFVEKDSCDNLEGDDFYNSLSGIIDLLKFSSNTGKNIEIQL